MTTRTDQIIRLGKLATFLTDRPEIPPADALTWAVNWHLGVHCGDEWEPALGLLTSDLTARTGWELTRYAGPSGFTSLRTDTAELGIVVLFLPADAEIPPYVQTWTAPEPDEDPGC